MRFSARAGRIGESATLKVARRAGELKASGVEVADFGAGEPDFDSPAVAVEAAAAALRDGFTRYAPTAGIPELRRALADRYRQTYGAPWTAEQVVVGVGAKAVLFELALVLFQGGDEVVLPSPHWVSFPEHVSFAGARLVSVPTAAETGFRIRAAEVLAALTAETRAVLLNSPCNPTGGVVAADDLAEIAAACAAREVLLIADETYERFVYDGARHASAASLAARYPETVVLVGSFSKTYAMTGWRVGYLLGPSEIVRAVTAVQSHATSNATAFAMKGAVAALRGAEPEVGAMIEEYQFRRDLVSRRLNEMPGVRCVAPAGAFYAFPDVSACYGPGRQGSIELAEFLLERARVAVVPGIDFGADRHVRISFACSREMLVGGLDRMAAALR